MQDLIDQLIVTVADEAEQLERFLTLLNQQQRHLVEGNVGAIEDNVHQQERELARSRDLESRRRKLVSDLALSLNEAPSGNESCIADQHSLRKLIALLSDGYGRRLSRLREKMMATTERIAHTKQQNEFLIRKSLTQIDDTMRLLAELTETKPPYPQVTSRPRPVRMAIDHVG